MKSITPFFFRYTTLFFEIIGIVVLTLFGFFMYNHFYVTLTNNAAGLSDTQQTQTQSLNISLYETVQQQHSQKKSQASIFQGYIIRNPFHQQNIGAAAEE